MKNRTLNEYYNSWTLFRMKIEKRAKGRCKLTKKNWVKLKHYHIEEFLKTCNNKFYFLFRLDEFGHVRRKYVRREKIRNSLGPANTRTIPVLHRSLNHDDRR